MLNRNIIFRNSKLLLAIGACLATWPNVLSAQTAPPAILHVDIENIVQYCGNVSDYSQLAATPSELNRTFRTFGEVLILADVVAVNGKPATLQQKAQSTNLRPASTAGQAIADTNRNGPAFDTLEILQVDGTPVGSIMTIAAVNGPPPPGAPSDIISGNVAVVGELEPTSA